MKSRMETNTTRRAEADVKVDGEVGGLYTKHNGTQCFFFQKKQEKMVY